MEGGVEAPDEPFASFFDLSLVNPTPTVINEASGLISPDVRLELYKSKFWRKFMVSCTHWHKFIVLNGAPYEKEILLKAIVSAVYFLPVMYHTENSDSIFYAEHCNPALDRLFRTGMCVSLPNGEEVNLEAVLCYIPVTGTQVQVRKTLSDCVCKRYNKNTFALNLVNFHKDPELYDLIYFPLSEPRNLLYILKIVKGLKKYIRSLSLAENELTVLQPLTGLPVFTTIKVLDLGSNKLKDVDVLNVLQQMKLTELVVESNPLCMPYNDSSAYIRKMKSILPTLNKLDGMLLIEDNDLCWYRNYLISHKSHALVDQFLERYFTLFDGDNRNQLQGIYHEKAVFSMTARYLPAQSSSSTARLSVYTLESRNLLKMSDCTKSFEQLSCGPEAVLATLCKLPRIEHDPYSFAVDCVQYSDDHAVINVTGVFRELSTMKEWPVRWFNRTFILLRVASQQYQIVNEMLHVSNATSSQSKGAFHIPRCKLMATSAGESMSDIDKRKMMEIFSQLTEMNLSWAEKCLDNSKWDMRDALQVFTELLKMNQIPKEAFVPEATRGVQLES